MSSVGDDLEVCRRSAKGLGRPNLAIVGREHEDAARRQFADGLPDLPNRTAECLGNLISLRHLRCGCSFSKYVNAHRVAQAHTSNCSAVGIMFRLFFGTICALSRRR